MGGFLLIIILLVRLLLMLFAFAGGLVGLLVADGDDGVGAFDDGFGGFGFGELPGLGLGAAKALGGRTGRRYRNRTGEWIDLAHVRSSKAVGGESR